MYVYTEFECYINYLEFSEQNIHRNYSGEILSNLRRLPSQILLNNETGCKVWYCKSFSSFFNYLE